MRVLATILMAALAFACEKAPESVAIAHVGDAAAGRALFVEKGCVLCHSVNSVGGKAAPALDAADPDVEADPLDFAARIWRGAPAMVEFQTVELGYVIDLSADDIAHLAAFAASGDEQKRLLPSAIPETMRDSLVDARYWETDDWSGFGAGDRADRPPPD